MSAAPVLPAGWRNWPEDQLEELLTGLQSLADEKLSGRGPWLCDREECDGLPHPGRRNKHARSEQRAPAGDEWDYWNLFAGRGFGKTRTGAEWAIGKARNEERGALVGPTAADVRDIADEPERLRGPQHHYAWADELAAWRYLQYAWDMLSMGMRLGEHPQVCTTTTPRPLPLIKWLKASERAVTVSGSTYANLHNLAPTFARTVVDRYAGTTLGRQELDAEILDDLPGALVRRAWIERARVNEAPELDMTVVSVDPAGTGTGDEAGILVLGRGTETQHAYVLADYSGQMSARETGLRTWRAFYDHGADVIVYEDNYGKQWLRNGLVDAYADYHGLDAEARAAIQLGDETRV